MRPDRGLSERFGGLWVAADRPQGVDLRVRTGLKGTPYELFMLLISALSIANDFLILFLHGPGSEVVFLIELLLIPLLGFDFLYRLATAPSRRHYLIGQHGWADFLAIVPLLGIFRIVRCMAVLRALREEGFEAVIADLEGQRAIGTFFITIWACIIAVELAGAAVFPAENNAPGSNIHTASDAIWWGLVTITTVGYGDVYPVTGPGRIIGTFLLIAGIALFSVLTGFIANFFIVPHGQRRRRWRRGHTTGAEIADLRELLVRQDELTGTIRRRLADLERSMATERRRAVAAAEDDADRDDAGPDDAGQDLGGIDAGRVSSESDTGIGSRHE
jgi:voltage-gated potassium channel